MIDDGYLWDDRKILLNSITKACKLINDRVRIRLPVHKGLLELILFEVHRYFLSGTNNQPYLCTMYQAMFALGYYGLLRVGELTESQHVIKTRNVHLAKNKNKLLIALYTSKTHGQGNYPQEIKIVSNRIEATGAGFYRDRHFCPFNLIGRYIESRAQFYEADDEQFFIFGDGCPVTPDHARSTLRKMIKNLGLNEQLYDMHSFRIGRCSDMVNKFNYSVAEAKRIGRWKSSCVYRYIRDK